MCYRHPRQLAYVTICNTCTRDCLGCLQFSGIRGSWCYSVALLRGARRRSALARSCHVRAGSDQNNEDVVYSKKMLCIERCCVLDVLYYLLLPIIARTYLLLPNITRYTTSNTLYDTQHLFLLHNIFQYTTSFNTQYLAIYDIFFKYRELGLQDLLPSLVVFVTKGVGGQIGWLREELMEMDTRQRRAFVKFVTASVCMPVEANPIMVHPQVRF